MRHVDSSNGGPAFTVFMRKLRSASGRRAATAGGARDDVFAHEQSDDARQHKTDEGTAPNVLLVAAHVAYYRSMETR